MLLAGAAVAIGVAGCGGKNRGATAPVAGKITVEGHPLQEGSVSFYPDQAKGNHVRQVPMGIIEGGKYEMFYLEKSGVPLGWYKVVVVAYEPPGSRDPRGRPGIPVSRIDKKYNNAETTPLAFEVREDAPPDAYDLALHVKIPSASGSP